MYNKIENDIGSGRAFTINTTGIFARDGTIELNPVGGNLTIGGAIELDNNASVNVYDGNNSRTLTLNGALSNGNGTGGNGSLVLNQTATVILAADSDFGGTTINAGTTLRVGAGGGTGTLGVGNTLNNSSLIFDRTGSLSYGGNISGSGTLTKNAAGALTLSGANTFSGGTTISAGTVSSTAAQGFGNGGSTVSIGAAGTANVALGADLNVNNVFTGTGNLTVSGSTGTPNFNNASALNGFTGTLNVNSSAGKKLALTTAGQNFGSEAIVNIASGATLYYNPLNATVNNVTFNLAGAGNTENLGALRIENGVTIGSASSIVASGNTQLGGNGTPTTINAVISETGGSRSIEKMGSGTMTFAGNNSYNGATILTAGTLSVSSDSSGAYNLGGTTGNNGITFNGGTLQITGTALTSFGSHTPTFTATKTVGLDIANAANNFTLSQTLNQTTGQLIKTGAGTLTLSGANTYTGGTRANAGTLVLSGSHTKAAGTTDFLSVNNVGAQNAVLKITAGTHGFTDFNIAEAANARAAVYQTGGDVSMGTTGGIGIKVGSGATTYGYYNLSGGTLTLPQALDFQVGGGSGATGVMDVTGGSITTGSWIVLGRNGAGNGLLNVTGGSFTSQANNIALNWANTAGSISILNVGGGAGAASVTGNNSASSGLGLSESTTVGTTAVANLLTNGTLTVGKVYATRTESTALLNFNGGTLKATTANAGTGFLTSGNIDGVYIYPNGGTIDNNGTSITISRPLLAPTDTGVSSISGPTTQGSGYIGAPLVTITGGTGSNATAYAVMADDGTGAGTYKISSIVVTSPGVYTVAPTTVTLTGGGAATAATGFTINTAANTSGGMTFQGSGTSAVYPSSTYTGGTTIANCTVTAEANNTTTSGHFGTGAVTVNGYGTLGKIVLGSGSVSGVNNSTVTVANNFALTNAFLYVQDQRQVISGTVAIGSAGATMGSTYNNAGLEADKGLILSGVVSGSGPITIQHTRIVTGQPYHVGFVAFNNNANTYSGTVTINENTAANEGGVYLGIYQPNALANAAVVANSEVPGTSLKFGNSPIVFNTGMGSAAIGSLSGAAKVVLTGYDGTNHTYTGGGNIALTVGGNNASTTYSGIISGGGSLTKSGTGTMTLSGVSTYTGNTIVSNGTLLVNSPGALGNTAVAVKTNAILGGSGSIGGTVTVEAGGTVAPGTSIGTLALGALTLNSGATAAMEIGDGPTGDKAVATGAVVYGGTLKLIWTGTTPASGTVDLFDGFSFSDGFSSLQFSNWPSAYRVTTNNLTTDGSITIAANNAPAANNLTAGVVRGGTTTLQIIGGKHSATDADGDSISVTAVGTPTSGSASFTSGSVSYTASGSTGTNTFTYTVTDPFGATDTKTVTVVVSDPQGFNQLASPVDLGGGTVALSYLGIPGVNYALDWTTNLTPPINWTGVLTNTAGANGTLNFTNTSGEPLNFYRTRFVSGP